MAVISSLLREAICTLGRDRLLDAEVLLAHALSRPRAFVFAHPEETVPPRAARAFRSFIRARADGMPVAYLTHEKEFYGLSFFVDERVLIPRPETETLIEVATSVLQKLPRDARVCDLGTGSGCIAVALALHHPDLQLTALDISPDALAVARDNAERHHVFHRISFLESDLMSVVRDEAFDLAVANLPYLGTSDTIDDSVRRYEPGVAVFSGENGTALYEQLFQQIRAMPFPPRFLVGECSPLLRTDFERMFHHYFSGKPSAMIQDAGGSDRVFLLQL